jgi:replicative DNA helicase
MESLTLHRPLPHNADAERYVLGSILISARGSEEIFDRLSADDFFLSQHRIIFRAMLAQRDKREPVELLSLHEELMRSGKLDDGGGIGYLTKLGDGIPHVGNVDFYARLVKEKARLRSVIYAAEKIQESAYDTSDPAAFLDEVIESLSAIARRAEEDGDETMCFRDAGLKLLETFDTDSGLRVYTDMDELDRLIGGFRAGELVLFTAETGVGKTLFAQQTRRRTCRDGRHALYASAEMLAPHLVSRELATEARVDQWKMRRDDCLSAEDRRSIVDAVSRECTRCRILDGELSLSRIRRAARQMKGRGNLDLAILDYDELIDAPGKDEFEQQRNLVRGAKSLAMELQIPVIVISQLRKALQGEDRKRPTLQRLYGTGAKPKHASIVIYVDRKFVRDLRGDETEARIVVLKNRDGRLRTLDAKFNLATLRFEDAAETGQRTRNGHE